MVINKYILDGALILLAMCFIVIFVKIVSSDGKADFCYVQVDTEWRLNEDGSKNHWTVMYSLFQHVPWRPDRIIVKVKSTEEVRKEAEQFGCKLQ